MTELLGVPLVILAGAVAVNAVSRGLTRVERRYVGWSFAAHATASIVQMVLFLYVYGGDMGMYLGTGEAMASLMERDFARYAPRVLDVVLQRPHGLPVLLLGSSSSWTMHGLAGFGLYFLGSAWAVSFFWAFASLLGKLALYRGLRSHFVPVERTGLMIACLLVPSVVFWTSTFMKEAVAFVGLGLLVYSLSQAQQRRFTAALVSAVPGYLFVSLVKPYILIALTLSAAAWIYSARAGANVRPLRLLFAVAIAIAGFMMLGEVFPEYGIQNIADQTAFLQRVGAYNEGGSNYAIAEAPAQSLTGQIAYAPLALLTTLFRPLLIEVRNPMMFANACETTFVLLTSLVALRRSGPKRIVNALMTRPALAFSVVFVVVFGVAVGLTSTNLGTLSRYRVPMMPFLVIVLFSFRALEPKTAAVGRRVSRLGIRRTRTLAMSPIT